MSEERLIEANTKLVDEKNMYKKEVEILERRINKALKFIKENEQYNVIPYELQEILKGEK